MRLTYIYTQKTFLNQKSFEVFEKYQIAVGGYIAYIFLIKTSNIEANIFNFRHLISIASIALIFLCIINIILTLLTIFTWIQYDKEEDLILNNLTLPIRVRILSWFETWLIALSICETVCIIIIVHFII